MALRGTLTHWKTRKLADILVIEPAHALGLLEAMWHVTAEDAPAGNIGRLSNTAIAMQMFTQIEPDRLIKAMVSSGHLERHSTHRLLVHDWDKYADYNVKRKLVRNHLMFLTKAGPVHPMADRDASSSANGGIPEPVPEPEPEINTKTTSLSADADTHTPPHADLQIFVESWNGHCGSLPHVQSFNRTRQRLLRARINEGLTVTRFTAAVIKAAGTPFCCGANKSNLRVTFDYLITDENHIARILEGSFDETNGAKPVRRVSNISSYRAPRHG